MCTWGYAATLETTPLFVFQGTYMVHCLNFGVKTLNNTPQFAAQFFGCYYKTGQVKGVKKVLKVIINDPLHL